jgi:hypothetical protein
MSKEDKIDALDEALRLIYLESAKDMNTLNTNKEIQRILSHSGSSVMSSSKEALLLQKLQSLTTSLSFGQLFIQAIQKAGTNEQTIATEIGLPLKIIQELKSDSVYTNNVPIVLFKNLLSLLNISFKAAEQSVRKTFEILQSNSSLKQEALSVFSPAFRKGNYKSGESLSRSMLKTDGKELFENKESLDKYLFRLNELMNN